MGVGCYNLKFPFSMNICVCSEDQLFLRTCKQLYGRYFYSSDLSVEKGKAKKIQVTVCPKEAMFEITLEINELASMQSNYLERIETKHPFRTIEGIASRFYIKDSIYALHAGGVAIGNKAYVFSASSGEGKSTLMAYLSARGLQYLSDDRIYLSFSSDNTPVVYPHSTPIHLREQGKHILDAQLQTVGLKIHYKNITHVNYWPISRYAYTPSVAHDKAYDLERIFFFNRGPDNKLSDFPIHTQEAFKRLLIAPAYEYNINSTWISRLTNVAKSSCWELQYKDMEWVYELLTSDIL